MPFSQHWLHKMIYDFWPREFVGELGANRVIFSFYRNFLQLKEFAFMFFGQFVNFYMDNYHDYVVVWNLRCSIFGISISKRGMCGERGTLNCSNYCNCFQKMVDHYPFLPSLDHFQPSNLFPSFFFSAFPVQVVRYFSWKLEACSWLISCTLKLLFPSEQKFNMKS